MADAPTTEFWKDIPAISDVFKPDALPEAYIANAPTDDERYYVPFSDTVSSRPLWISPTQNKWADILYAKAAGLVNRHYHPHEVFAYTISGKWGYLEHDWIATAGDFVYESPGEGHTLWPTSTRSRCGPISSSPGRWSGSTRRARASAISTSSTTSPCAVGTTTRSASAPA